MVTVDNIRETRFSHNPQVCHVFGAFEWVRELNEGVGRMFREMEEQGLPDPEYSEPSGFAVRMVLRNNIEQRIPRLKGQESHLQSHDDTVNDTVNDTIKPSITERQQEMLAILRENPRASYDDLAKVMGVSRATIARDISRLQERSLLGRTGSDKAGTWVVLEK